MNRKYWIETYGCEMNKAESSALKQQLSSADWTITDSPEEAELILVNTCTVRKTAEDRIRGRLGELSAIKKDNNTRIIVFGCMAQHLKQNIVDQFPAVDAVVGTFEKQDLLRHISNGLSSYQGTFTEKKKYRFYQNHAVHNPYHAFIPVMHGCNNFCSYCIVPYVRGPEISRSPEEVFQEIARLEMTNCKEIILLGQNVNSYSYTTVEHNTILFPDLLEEIAQRVATIRWIRFLTSHPKDLSDRLIAVIRDNNRVCNHIHIPVQSGSNRVLHRMNRGYTKEDYVNVIKKITDAIPDITLSTDLMVGFPGETRDDFNETLHLVKEIGFIDAFTYKYNRREGTVSASWEDTVTEAEKTERLQLLIETQRSISSKRKKRKIGNVVQVLVENLSKKNKNEMLGRTETNEMVVLPGDASFKGRIVTVKLLSLKGNTFKGEQVV